MNFVGISGKVENLQLDNKTAELHCCWLGPIDLSQKPPHVDVGSFNSITGGTLYDYDGSITKFNNKDPKYLLPPESNGLIINKVVISDKDLTSAWAKVHGGFFIRNFHELPLINQYCNCKAKKFMADLNSDCADGKIKVCVVKGEVDDRKNYRSRKNIVSQCN